MPPAAGTTTSFSDRLFEAINRARAPVCVGLDPVLERLPAALRGGGPGAGTPVEAIEAFSLTVIDAVRGLAPAVKLQSACYERYGAEGVAALRRVAAHATAAGMVVILDAKRGDIGVTAEHYAAAGFATPADAMTISPYLGPDTLEPFVRPGCGVFVLVRTSNPGSDAVQSLRLADGRSVAEMIADHVAVLGRSRIGAHGLSDVGAVVAGTKPEDGPALRRRMADQVFLIPGYGAQGGTAADVRGMLRASRTCPGDAGVLVTASRSVIYAFENNDPAWPAAIGGAAAVLAGEIRAILE